jgi:hypothetical protein
LCLRGGRAVKWGRNIRFRNIVRFRSDKALMVIGTGLITSEFQRMLWLTKEWCLARGPRPWLVCAPTVKVCGWSDNYRGGANSCDYSSFVGQSSGDEMNHCICDEVIDKVILICELWKIMNHGLCLSLLLMATSYPPTIWSMWLIQQCCKPVLIMPSGIYDNHFGILYDYSVKNLQQ